MASAAIVGPKVVGQKPPTFLWWLFGVLNAQPGDQLDDLFPGSGAVARAWEAFMRQAALRPAPTTAKAAADPLFAKDEVAS